MQVTRFQQLPAAEVGALWTGRPHRRHLGGALLGLASRGHLRVTAAGSGPDGADWGLDVLPHEGLLRPHERHLLDLVSAAPGGRLSALREKRTARRAVAAVRGDVVERGWARRGRFGRRTRAGRGALAELRAVRRALEHTPPTPLSTHLSPPLSTAELLPLALVLGLGDLWLLRLGRLRPPPPRWFEPGTTRETCGWLGVVVFAGSAGAPLGAGFEWVDLMGLVDVASALDS